MPKWRVGFSGTAAKVFEAHEVIKGGPKETGGDGGLTFRSGTGELIAHVAEGWKYVELVSELQSP
jgi:hypothetical protein